MWGKMAARQMEDIQRKLAMLNYPRANAPAQSLLFAGMERYALLEWLFFRSLHLSLLLFFQISIYLFLLNRFAAKSSNSESILSIFYKMKMGFFVFLMNCRLLGDKSPFSQQSTQGDAMDRDEETSRIQCNPSFLIHYDSGFE